MDNGRQEGNRARFGKSGQMNECAIVLTGIRGAKTGDPVLRVRCYCMAVFGSKKMGSSFKYNPIGEARTIREAREIWETHVNEKRLTSINLDDTFDAKEE